MKIFDLLQDAIYDIVGYILPGLIALPFLFLLYCSKFRNSSMYYLQYSMNNPTNLSALKDLININLSNCIPLLILAYIIGLTLKYLSLFTNNLLNMKYIKLIFKNKYTYYIYCLFRYSRNEQPNSSHTYKNLINSYSSTLCNNYSLSQNVDFIELFKNNTFIQEYARTTARFNKHTNLTQKYIAKTNLFSSLSCLFFLEFLNSIISMIIYTINGVIYYSSSNIIDIVNIITPVIISCILGILFITCYSEFKDHKEYQLNENFFYLIETYYKKNSSPQTNSTNSTT